ncbi:25 kDa integral membrane protein [Schistosoma japonicum]|nr:25 kDa integral membrane protein [Schistosoma japonicum]
MKLLINEQFWRKLFIILNSLLLVFSIVLIALGSDTIYNLRKYNTILHVPPPEIIPTVIFTGCLGTIACLLGFTGLFKPKHSSFLLYIIALTVTTVIEMSSAIASTITTDQFEINARISLMESIKSFNVNVNYMEEFNRLQQHFECCGALSYLDYSRQVSDLPSTCKVKTLVYAQVSSVCIDTLNCLKLVTIFAIFSKSTVLNTLTHSLHLIIQYVFRINV